MRNWTSSFANKLIINNRKQFYLNGRSNVMINTDRWRCKCVKLYEAYYICCALQYQQFYISLSSLFYLIISLEKFAKTISECLLKQAQVANPLSRAIHLKNRSLGKYYYNLSAGPIPAIHLLHINTLEFT